MAITDTYIRAAEHGMLTSGVLAADTAIKTSAGKVYWISMCDSADLALELNDSTDGTGTDKWAWILDVDVVPGNHIIFDPPLEFAAGIYLDVSTTTCKVTVGYI